VPRARLQGNALKKKMLGKHLDLWLAKVAFNVGKIPHRGLSARDINENLSLGQ